MIVDGLSDFLNKNPFIILKPLSQKGEIILEGTILLNHKYKEYPLVNKNYDLKIVIPHDYPLSLPVIKEVSNIIPKDDEGRFHVNPDDSLCLGSPIRLKLALLECQNINDFFDKFLVHFLYAASLKLDYGMNWIFGELPHGNKGEILDYRNILSLSEDRQVIYTFSLLSMKKRIANKKKCPCSCGLRLGKCSFRYKIISFRKIFSRNKFAQIAQQLAKDIES